MWSIIRSNMSVADLTFLPSNSCKRNSKHRRWKSRGSTNDLLPNWPTSQMTQFPNDLLLKTRRMALVLVFTSCYKRPNDGHQRPLEADSRLPVTWTTGFARYIWASSSKRVEPQTTAQHVCARTHRQPWWPLEPPSSSSLSVHLSAWSKIIIVNKLLMILIRMIVIMIIVIIIVIIIIIFTIIANVSSSMVNYVEFET